MRKLSKLLLAVLVIGAIVIFSGCESGLGGISQRSPEDVALKVVNSMLEADAETFYSLLSDEVKEQVPQETDKLAIHALQQNFDEGRKSFQGKYGKKWKYEVNIIDIFECEPPKDMYTGRETMKAELEIIHEGSGFLKDKEGSDTMTVYLVKSGSNWYLADF